MKEKLKFMLFISLAVLWFLISGVSIYKSFDNRMKSIENNIKQINEILMIAFEDVEKNKEIQKRKTTETFTSTVKPIETIIRDILNENSVKHLEN